VDLQVIILCGGLGTRMGAVTDAIPKPMVTVGGRPLLWHIMKGFSAWGCRRFVLCLGWRGDVIRSWFLHRRHLGGDVTVGPGGEVRMAEEVEEAGWSVTLADTGWRTTTGGRLLGVRGLLDPDRPALMTYGDGVADVDLEGLLAHHRAAGRLATVTAMRARSRFGVLDLDGRGGVTAFREKPLLEQRVSGGFFVLEPAAFDWFDAAEPLEEGALSRLAEADQLTAWPHEGFWMSVDTPRDLASLEALWADGVRPWLTPGAGR
jgi:glucose-1-phosphate cytidylyltransferase